MCPWRRALLRTSGAPGRLPLAGLILALGLQAPALLAGEPESPLRLRLSVDRRALAPGQSTRVTVGFADAEYRPARNDRARVVDLRLVAGGGRLEPERVEVEAGAFTSVPVSFVAGPPGEVMIEAASGGLASVRVLLVVRQDLGRRGLDLLDLLVPVAHAQAPLSVGLRSLSRTEVPLGSRAEVALVPNGPLLPGQTATVRIVAEAAEAAVRMLVGDAPATGMAQVTLHGSEPLPLQLWPDPPRAGPVHVRAEVFPGGPSSWLDLHFAPPRATRILVATPPGVVPSHQRELTLGVCLTDQESKCFDSLATSHEVRLGLSTGGVSARFDPATVTLSPGKPRDEVRLELGAFRTESLMRLSAWDAAHQLRGEALLEIAVATWLLLACASLGGAFGGLARAYYGEASGRALSLGRLARGERTAWAHLGFSGGFGVVLFEAAHLSLLGLPSLPALPSLGSLGLGLAFVLGTLGGYGGVLVLDRLFDRVLPAPRPKPA